MSRLLATAAVAISLAVSAAELRGPLPILSVPYHDDGALDVETLVKEARFVADAGVGIPCEWPCYGVKVFRIRR
jgi:hypothetical protein